MMKVSELLVVFKKSKFEWDQSRFHLSRKELLLQYQKQGVFIQRILASHERQKEALERLKKILKGAQFVSRKDFLKRINSKIKVVIALGGDNHFQFVAHEIRSVLMIGVNSDPKLSEGALTYFTTDTLEMFLPQILNGKFQEEAWPRMRIKLNRKLLPVLAVSEVFLGEAIRNNMSRYRISFKGRQEIQKSSGFLIATGAGSTGWYDSACRYLFPKGNSFPKNRAELHFLATEPFRGKLAKPFFLHGILKRRDLISLKSLNDSRGVLVVDALKSYFLNEGDVVEVSLGPSLRVLASKFQ